MVDVLVSSDSIDVLGGSSKVNVDISLGQKGQRGSYIFAGNGNPNDGSTTIPEPPKPYDMFINLNPNEDQYLYLYQYLNKDGAYTWQALLRLIPNTFLKNYGDEPAESEFVNGVLTYNLPIIDVIPLASVGVYNPGNFNIQYSIVGQLPISSSIIVGTDYVQDENNQLVLPITVKAVELNPTTGWQPLNGSHAVHFIITIV